MQANKRYLFLLTALSVNPALSDGPSPINFKLMAYQESDHNVVYLYAHGLGATHQQGQKLYPRIKGYDGAGKYAYHKHWLVDGPLALFDFADAKNDNDEFHRKHVNLGQEPDVLRLDQAYQRTLQRIPKDHKIVIMGLSRGATTILNWLALRQPQRVAAAVIESAFDKLENVILHLMKQFKVHWVPLSGKLGSGLMRLYFPGIDVHGIMPLKTVTKINHEIPVLLIHSKKDQVIPIKSSRNIYCEMLLNGHTKVHLLEILDGRHGKIMRDSQANTVQNVTHAFFAHYDLPHEPTFARDGLPIFNMCQPPAELVRQRTYRSYSLEDTENYL